MKKAKELIKGDEFKLPKKRKWLTVRCIVQLGDRPTMPMAHRGMLLIVVEGCRQIVINPETELELKCNQ